MPAAEPSSLLALRYMVDFRCIGGDCEDNCCHSGWAIYVDQEHLIKLRRLLPRSAEATADGTQGQTGEPDAHLPPFDQAVVPLPKKERSERAYGQLRLGADGSCPLLGSGGLCRLHARFGEEALPDTCATYPRHLSRVGQRLELAGSLSCPEIARRALLPADGTDLVPADLGLAGRGQLQHTAPPAAGSHGEAAYRHLDVVRGAIVRLLSLPGYALRSRLFFATFLAHKCQSLRPGPHGVLDTDAFLQQAAMLNHPEALSELDRRLGESLTTAPLPLPLLLSLLRTQRRVPGGQAFTQLVFEIAQTYRSDDSSPNIGQTTGHTMGHTTNEIPANDPAGERPAPGAGERMDVTFVARRQAVEGAFAARLERYFFNYARHFWMKEWYLHSPSLAAHMQGFLARVALLRFALLSHPQALAATQAATPGAGEALLDALAVRVFYSLSRSLEHSGGFRAALASEVDAKAPALADAISLLAV
jgi:lysine-N-methylase